MQRFKRKLVEGGVALAAITAPLPVAAESVQVSAVVPAQPPKPPRPNLVANNSAPKIPANPEPRQQRDWTGLAATAVAGLGVLVWRRRRHETPHARFAPASA